MATDGLAGKTAFVTGAASGIGRATALGLLADGATVIATDVNEVRLNEVSSMAGDTTARLHVLALDVSDRAAVDDAVDEVAHRHGLHIVCNVAGVLDAMAPVHEIDDAQWERVLKVNLTGAFYVARRAAPFLLSTGGGVIVNVASAAGLRGGLAGAAYTASKHGLVGLTRSIAWMYAKDGLRCNAVCPGGVKTSIGESAPPFSGLGMERLGPVLKAAVRTASSDEIAAVIRFLASDSARSLNGAVLVADGGWSAG
jgi:NAD(P)-dependent dehydrogenase (short-subunit alcohol dehydrogenase family)